MFKKSEKKDVGLNHMSTPNPVSIFQAFDIKHFYGNQVALQIKFADKTIYDNLVKTHHKGANPGGMFFTYQVSMENKAQLVEILSDLRALVAATEKNENALCAINQAEEALANDKKFCFNSAPQLFFASKAEISSSILPRIPKIKTNISSSILPSIPKIKELSVRQHRHSELGINIKYTDASLNALLPHEPIYDIDNTEFVYHHEFKLDEVDRIFSLLLQLKNIINYEDMSLPLIYQAERELEEWTHVSPTQIQPLPSGSFSYFQVGNHFTYTGPLRYFFGPETIKVDVLAEGDYYEVCINDKIKIIPKTFIESLLIAIWRGSDDKIFKEFSDYYEKLVKNLNCEYSLDKELQKTKDLIYSYDRLPGKKLCSTEHVVQSYYCILLEKIIFQKFIYAEEPTVKYAP